MERRAGDGATTSPRVVPAAALIIVGAVVMIIGTFLPWVTGNGESINGWDLADMSGETNDAGVYVALGVILAGLAIAMLAAGRVLAVAIIAVVIASFAAIAAVIDVSDDGGMGAFGFSIGAGLYIILVAAIAVARRVDLGARHPSPLTPVTLGAHDGGRGRCRRRPARRRRRPRRANRAAAGARPARPRRRSRPSPARPG